MCKVGIRVRVRVRVTHQTDAQNQYCFMKNLLNGQYCFMTVHDTPLKQHCFWRRGIKQCCFKPTVTVHYQTLLFNILVSKQCCLTSTRNSTRNSTNNSTLQNIVVRYPGIKTMLFDEYQVWHGWQSITKHCCFIRWYRNNGVWWVTEHRCHGTTMFFVEDVTEQHCLYTAQRETSLFCTS